MSSPTASEVACDDVQDCQDASASGFQRISFRLVDRYTSL